MKYLKMIIVLILISLLTACSKSSFMDLSVFIYNFNNASQQKIAFTDVTFETLDGITEYQVFVDSLLICLTADESNKIFKVKLFMLKSEDETKNITQENANDFTETLKNVIMSFCSYTEEQAKLLIQEFSLDKNDTLRLNGELSKDTDMFKFVYFSNELANEMIIYNTALKEVESTKKPESRPYFAEVTSIRTETVPYS